MKSWSLFLAASLLAGCAATSDEEAGSSEANLTQDKSILALGDSIAFGWNPNLEKNDSKVVASNYHGYAELLGDRMGLRVENTSCPGEASGSFLDKGAEDNGCDKNRAAYKLHSTWGTAPTQIEVAVASLKKSIANGTPPEVVTLSIGGNDLLLMQRSCDGWGFAASGCLLGKLPFAEHSYGAHLESIIKTIDDTGYRGTMVIVTIHAPDYSDMIANFGLGRFNSEIRESVSHVSEHLGMTVKVADGFAAFKTLADKHGGKTCETGLLIKNADGSCDIHPSAAGHALLADTIANALAE